MGSPVFDSLGYTGGMRRGYTTGSCAAAAAKGAAMMLFSRETASSVSITLPGGQAITLPLEECTYSGTSARCAVRKDSGDDPDGTDGMLIFAGARRIESSGVRISGGPGIGRITRKGLPLQPGEWAINPGPRRMIEMEVGSVLPPGQGVEITISAPEGEKRAKNTWNPRLGIEGGISILGTTGIVEPKSTAAYLSSIDLYISSAAAFDSPRPGAVFLVPGYVGEQCLRERFQVPGELVVRIGDHVGHALRSCVSAGAAEVFLYGHVGKWAKVAAGLFNTNCEFGDARLETLAACAGAEGATTEQIREILSLPLAEEAVLLLRKWNLSSVFSLVAERAHMRCSLLLGRAVPLGVGVLSLEGEVLGSFPAAEKEVRTWTELLSSE